jgi:hypothetical protein
MTILLIVAIVSLVLLVGALLAFVFSRAERAVARTKTALVQEERAFNPGVTLGHRVEPQATFETQYLQARKVAAKKAAATPRGANARVGSIGPKLMTASVGLKDDAISAVKIAEFHGWDGARLGIPAGGVPVAAAIPVAAAVAAPAGPVEVVAGRDYVEIPITDGMSPEEVRKARAANAKARSAAMKAAKTAQSGAAAPVAAAAGAAAVAAPAVGAAAPVGVSIEPPKLIEITDSMSPEEVRKARIANSKTMSAYNKALKAAGDAVGVAPAAPVAPAVAAAPAAAAPVAVGIAPPKLIEITDAMSPDEVRKARIANSKATSAYNKALKEAGVDPAAAAAPAAPAATPVPAAPAQAPAPAAPAAAPAGVAGIAPPQLIEITDSMSPEEIRRARVENSKVMSAYNKALKAAGIDPASVK